MPKNIFVALLSALSRKSPSGVSHFCNLLASWITSTFQTQSAFNAYQAAQKNPTVNIIQVGNNMRLRSLPNGVVVEVLYSDGNWHAQQTYINTTAS